MKRWWRALLAVAALVLFLVVGFRSARPWLEQQLVRLIQNDLATALAQPVSLEGFDVDIFPPRLQLARLTVGVEAAPAFELQGLATELDPFSWTATVRVERVVADLTKWPAKKSETAVAGPLSLTWLPSLSLVVGEMKLSDQVESQPCEVLAKEPQLRLQRRLEQFDATIDCGDLTLQRAEENLHFSQVNAQASFGTDERIFLRSAHANGDAGSVSLAPAENQSASAPLEVHVSLDRLAKFLGLAEPMSGQLNATGEARLPVGGLMATSELALDAKIEIEPARYDDYSANHVSGILTIAHDQITFRDLKLNLDQGTVNAEGDLSLSAPNAFHLKANSGFENVATVAPNVSTALMSGQGSLQVDVDGQLRPLSLAGTVDGTVKELRRVTTGEAMTKVSSASAETLDTTFTAKVQVAPNGSSAVATVRFSPSQHSATEAGSINLVARMDSAGGLSGTGDLKVSDARRLRPLIPQISGGEISGKLVLSGTRALPRLEGTVAAQNIDLGGTRFEQIGGTFTATPQSLEARPLELKAVGGVARLEGRIALSAEQSNDWRATVDHVDLAALWTALNSAGVSLPYTTGVLNGNASASGSWSQVDLNAQLSSGPISVAKERFAGGVSIKARSKAQKWIVDAALSRRPEEFLRIAGAGTGLENMWLSAWSTPWEVAGFRSLDELPPRRGHVVLNADLYGRVDAPLGRAQVTVEDLGIGERSFGTLTGEVDSLPQGIWRLVAEDAGGRVRVDASVKPGNGRPFSVQAQMRDFDLAQVLAPQQSTTMICDATAQFDGRLGDPARSLSGQLTATRFVVAHDELSMGAKTPVMIRARDGRLQIESFNLEGDFGSVSAEGTIGLAGDLDLALRIDADARILEAIPKSPVRWASGNASLDAHIRRAAGGTPEVIGHGSVQQLSVDLGLPFLMTDAVGSFDLQGSRVTLEQIRGAAGGGTFMLGGYVDAAEGPCLQWQAKEVSTGLLDWLQDEVSGKGEIRGSWNQIEVTGDVRILSALYDRDVELTDLLPIFRRQLGSRPPKPGEKAVALSFHVHAPDSIFIDNNIAKAEFRANLQITGTDLQPLLNGEIELLEGEARLFDRRFLITLGRVTFDGKPKVNPALEFSATTDVSTAEGEYNLYADVTGTLDDPRIKLSADDSTLTANDVAMLLTVGKTMAQLQSEGSGGLSTSDVASLAPVLYGSQVERGVKQFLPVDRFSLEPGFSRTTGDFEPKLTVGTQLARGLRGTVSTTVSAQNENSVQLEYQLTPRTLLLATWDSRTQTNAGGFGGGIKFRYQFRYPPHYTLLPSGWWKLQ